MILGESDESLLKFYFFLFCGIRKNINLHKHVHSIYVLLCYFVKHQLFRSTYIPHMHVYLTHYAHSPLPETYIIFSSSE